MTVKVLFSNGQTIEMEVSDNATDREILADAGYYSEEIGGDPVCVQWPFEDEDEEELDEATFESADDQKQEKEKTVGTPDTSNGGSLDGKTQDVQDALVKNYKAADPRMYRYDEFFLTDKNSPENAIRIPFASDTIATAFAENTWTLEKKMGKFIYENSDYGKNSKKDSKFSGYMNNLMAKNTESTSSSSNADREVQPEDLLTSDSTKIIMHDTTPFENEPFNYGVQSLMNPYSLTKLAGGIDNVTSLPDNYMYDVRDHRRFYGFSINSNDVLTVSNPTYTQIIEWANSDKWGRTPYSWLDFVYCKYFGIIPTNRLITLRRYSVPTYDNLQFESMYGEIENKTEGLSNTDTKENRSNKTFSPHAYVVSYFGGESGNTLPSLMNFSTGMNWKDIESKIHDVQADPGEDPQMVIDRLLDGSGGRGSTTAFGTAAWDAARGLLESGSFISSKIVSYGKFALSTKNDIGLDNDAAKTLFSAQVDPYDGLLANRIRGPLNRIEKVKARDKGIMFSQSLSIKCSYKAKSIGGAGGVNPKAALLDILGNCMEMASPTAVFWGGGQRFMVQPRVYPFHDGGWRDSFMKKIYDGNFLGEDGAISTALSGIKKIAQNDGKGEVSFDNFTANLGNILGEGVAMLGSAISSIGSIFGDNSLLSKAGDKLTDVGTGGDAKKKENAQNKKNALFKNLQNLWHSKMIKETALPTITGMGSLLIGEPVGEWHLTVGNPLNPIMVVGNLICTQMDINWDDEIGPDDFPTGFEVTYKLEHGMARDKEAIQSMFNRGMGKIYSLPDYMYCSSDRVTHVDKFTEDQSAGDTGTQPYMSARAYYSMANNAAIGGNLNAYQGNKTAKIPNGTTPANHGNANTQLVTKFTPVDDVNTRTVSQMRTEGMPGSYSRVKSLAATRKIFS